ncbi:hypothetical protein FB472_2164 [Rhodoglobus vestalii]|uniref:CopC domain-containing protein n=1 Tax=Rhodoglobus vestalii TaxID=193384 RepID=A0A8H2PYN8_9MICO|nr:copper resistance protein CopC [Rhodoglobus vestalii]TQO20529.1 hypothetical protein FB472_2164 [Rhodoglobus vestalii]
MTIFRTFARLVGAVLLTAVLLMGAPLAVSAHDQIIGQFPNEDETVEVGPDAITLEFTGDLMDITQLAMVVDADGTDWVNGPLQVDRRTATQPLLPELPAGSYQVRWRVVSSDGHPISGVFEFAVGRETPGATFGLEESAAQQADAATSSTADGSGTTVLSPLLVTTLIGAAVGIALFAGVIASRWFFIQRKK